MNGIFVRCFVLKTIDNSWKVLYTIVKKENVELSVATYCKLLQCVAKLSPVRQNVFYYCITNANKCQQKGGVKMQKIFYTCEEVAEIYMVSKYTVWRWIKSGRISAVKIGRNYRIRKEDVERIEK